MAASSLAPRLSLASSSPSGSSPEPPDPPPPTTSGKRHLKQPAGDVDQEPLSKSQPNKKAAQDFLPPEMLEALRLQQLQQEKEPSVVGQLSLSPRKQYRSPKRENESGLPSVRPPANLWSYPRQRSKFTHLTNHPPCVCGAGSSDISFLYDIPEGLRGREQRELPASLVPEEYHIHKKIGVVGLEFHQDQYTTQSLAHDNHVTVFPSMNPGGRYEVLALKNTMELMLKRAGLPRDESDLDGPTQVHKLLELVTQEQLIYSICFHEVIRQVSVQCAERGELLQDIRSRYTQLLDRIPRQVMSLHEDLLSQRALCKRISAEFQQFRARISSITDRLEKVRDMDAEVIDETLTAHRDLSSALTESEKNANLLQEYHQLYELQRKRLQESVDRLRSERELWEGAAYGLARQVVAESEAQQVRTLRRLQLGEQAWSQLALHFSTFLSQTDIRQLREVNECVGQWREGVVRESERLEEMEGDMSDKLASVENDMKIWCEELNKSLRSDEKVVPPGQETLSQLWEGLGVWLSVLNSESDKFSGEAQLSRTERLHSLHTLVERWTELGLEIFSRHSEMNQYDHTPYGRTHTSEHQTMLSLGADVETGMRHCTARASGDNGVAVGFIRLITPLETWEARLGQCVRGNKRLPDSEWAKLRVLMGEWLDHVRKVRSFIGRVTSEDSSNTLQCTPMNELSVAVETWRCALSHAIANRHTKIASMVADMHSSLVLWMVKLMLTATHTTWAFSGDQREREAQCEEGGEGEVCDGASGEEVTLVIDEGGWDEGMGLRRLLLGDVGEECEALTSSLQKFTTALTRSVSLAVEREAENRRREGDPESDQEKELLEKLGKEAGQWAEQAQLLMIKVLKAGKETKEKEETRNDGKDSAKVGSTIHSEGGLSQEIFVMGPDFNLRSQSLQEVVSKIPQPDPPSLAELGLLSVEDMPKGSEYLPEDTEKLARQLSKALGDLEEQKRLTEKEKERAEEAERKAENSQSIVSSLEAELQQTRSQLEEMRELQSSKTAPRGGGRAGKRGRTGARPPSKK